MKPLIPISAISVVCGIIATAFLCTSFFTGVWVKVYKIPEVTSSDIAGDQTAPVSVERIVHEHGLWDNGLADLNCAATPFSICMYTRASLFAGLVLIVPGILLNIISMAIILSGGRLDTSGTLAKASGMIMTLANIGALVGLLLFTLQHTVCITSCPPEHNFYPTLPDDLSFGWSFMLGWIGLGFLLANATLLFTFACLVQKRYKVSFSPNRNSTGRPITPEEPEGINIELVRMNQNAAGKHGAQSTTERHNRRV